MPKVNLIFDGNSDDYETVEEFQKIIFLENNSTYKVEFINNIFKVFSCGQLYKKDSEINISPSGNYLNLTGSNLYISNDAEGVNEFDVQNIQIIGDSHDLFLDTIMQLRGEIVDIDKVYNKEYKWSSSNPEIATVDNTGLVTSKGIGTTTIILECDGHVAEYEINVIERQEEVVPIEEIEIRSKDGHAQESELRDGDYEFEVVIKPTEADILSIYRTIYNNNHPDRQAFILNGERVEEVNDVTTVQVNLNGGAFAVNRDPVTLTCQVVDKTGITLSTTFNFYNKNSICFASDTLIHTLDGMVKVSELNEDSQILTFNHFNGKFEYKKIALLVNHGLDDYKILRLKFEKLNSIDIINFHSFFDYDLMKYVNINIDNVNDYIGHRFVFLESKKHCFYKLIDSEIVSRKTSSYSFITEENLNFYANGVLNCTPDVLLNLNVFDFNKEIQYRKEEVNTALAKYKLCSLNDFCAMYGDDVDAKYYYKFNLKMLNIYLAKGVYSNISVNGMILYLNKLIEKGEALIY